MVGGVAGRGFCIFLAVGKRRRRLGQTAELFLARLGRRLRWALMGPPMRTGRRVPRGRRGKRKRVLYRRFLVSLGARRRIPTRPSLRRRRETPHDKVSCGSSSKLSPSKFQHTLRRTIFF